MSFRFPPLLVAELARAVSTLRECGQVDAAEDLLEAIELCDTDPPEVPPGVLEESLVEGSAPLSGAERARRFRRSKSSRTPNVARNERRNEDRNGPLRFSLLPQKSAQLDDRYLHPEKRGEFPPSDSPNSAETLLIQVNSPEFKNLKRRARSAEPASLGGVTSVTKTVTDSVTLSVTPPNSPHSYATPEHTPDGDAPRSPFAAVSDGANARALWRSAYDIWTTVAHDGKRCGDPSTHRRSFESIVRDAEARSPASPLELIAEVTARYVARCRKQDREPTPRFLAVDFAVLADWPPGVGNGSQGPPAVTPKQREYRAAAAEWKAAQESGDAERIAKAQVRAERAGKAMVRDG